MATINVHAAKTQFLQLLERAAQGEEVVIAKVSRSEARPVAIESAGPLVTIGRYVSRRRFDLRWSTLETGFAVLVSIIIRPISRLTRILSASLAMICSNPG